MRLPLTVWGISMPTVLAACAFPALFVSAIMMILDLTLGHEFLMPAVVRWENRLATRRQPLCFNTCSGSSAPEVYSSLCRPSASVVRLLSVHARKNIFAIGMMVWAIVPSPSARLVWAHHMYVSGMKPVLRFFFATTTLIIAVPRPSRSKLGADAAAG